MQKRIAEPKYLHPCSKGPHPWFVPPLNPEHATVPAIWGRLSSRNNEDHVSHMVLDLMSHDPANVIQW
jgi:hypothetical protein